MSTLVCWRRFLTDYVRNPVNLLLLVVVPVVFVVVAAGSLVDAAKLLGGAGNGVGVATATAGWAAGFLAGVAMYFQMSAAREADRGLVIAGLLARRLVTARLLTGLTLAVLASAAALVALQLRAGVDDAVRAAFGTLMFAVVYLGIGAVVGALVRNTVNGTVLILFIWILDVFFGPTMSSGADKVLTRLLPTHFVTLWMTDLPLRHGGRFGDLGIAVGWTIAATVLAFAVVVAAVRGGLLSMSDACARYRLTTEEFLSWQTQVDRNGLHGLRATRIQEYRGSARRAHGHDARAAGLLSERARPPASRYRA